MIIFKKKLQLIPFSLPSDFAVTAELCVTDQNISVGFEVRGPTNTLNIKGLLRTPPRRDRLWENTCFELFLKTKDRPAYYEANVSTSGEWNIYEFSDYRQGMRTVKQAQPIISKTETSDNSLKTEFVIAKNSLEKLSSNSEVFLGISCILKDKTGRESFWAIKHKKEKPDFHLASNYILVPITHI